jgi:hypothetical protein
MRLRDLLDQAIETSQEVVFDTAQPGLWSDSAVAFVAGELWQRRRT